MRIIRFFFQIIAIILSVFYYGGLTLLSPKRKNDDYFHNTAKKWGNSILKIAGVEIKIEGLNKINPKETYVFVSNHSSLFDIPVLQSALPCNFRIVYKKELEKIPFFGYVLRKSPYISIIREDSKDAMKGIKQAIEDFQKGASVLLFPEGTRSVDGNLQSFKRGAFVLAAKSRKPIVPITLIGTNKIMPKGRLKFVGGEVRVIIHEPIPPPESPTKMLELEIQNKVYEIIKHTLQQYQESLC